MSGDENQSEDRWSQFRLLQLVGPLMAVVWVGGVLISTLLFPSFSWTTNTLAEVGRAGEPSALLFDSSFVIGALLGLVSLRQPWTGATNLLQRLGVVLLGLLITLIGVAQLGLQNPWFELIALALILGLLPAFAVSGSGDIIAGHERRGILAVWLGIIHIFAWQIISIILRLSAAIPTLISIVLISVWVLVQQPMVAPRLER